MGKIQILRGTSAQRTSSTRTLEMGQPFYEVDTNLLYVGTGDGIASAKPVKAVHATNAENAQNSQNAQNAVRATSDGNGNNIAETYMKAANIEIRDTDDIVAGETALEHGKIILVYES